MINQSIYQKTVVLKIILKLVLSRLTIIVERRRKLNKTTSFYRKILIVFDDDIGLIDPNLGGLFRGLF